jgi:hypothetical protein
MSAWRDSILTAEQFAAVVTKIADGNSTKASCEAVGVARGMFYRTIEAPDSPEEWPGLSARRRDTYTRAQSAHWLAMADDAAALSDQAIQAESNVTVQGLRLAVDTRKWLLSKALPKQYGDKVDVDVGGNVTITLSKDDAAL